MSDDKSKENRTEIKAEEIAEDNELLANDDDNLEITVTSEPTKPDLDR